MPVSNLKVIIFDMYGVILKDPEGGLLPFVNRSFPELTYNDVYKHWQQGNIGAISSAEFFHRIGYTGDPEELMQQYLDSIEIDESFDEVAKALQQHYRLALLSNDLAEWSAYLRQKFNLDRYFASVVISGVEKIKKPDLRLLNKILESLNVTPAECLLIDDRVENLNAAEQVGMQTLLFNSRKVYYPGNIVNSFAELMDYISS